MEPLHQPNNIIAKKYRIISILGEGGSGITYLAEDLQNNKNVAFKALSLHRITDWKAMELFEREAKILAQLNHPAIPQYLEYFDADTDEGKHFYIAQQLAPGDSLAKLVEENWRTNEQQVKDIAEQILEILIYLHSLETPVTHRDIKPQNIIRDENGKVFLVDFGAVQDTYYSTFMRGSTVVGTYGYMAPEQFRGKCVPATDLYGLGATLLFLLTHRSPADFPTDGLKIDFRSRVQVSDDFADWLDKMLEPDLEERFSSAKEALEVLRGKRKIIAAAKKPMLWKAVVGMGISVLVTVGIFNNYKWAILDKLGFKHFATTCGDLDKMRSFLNQGGKLDMQFVDKFHSEGGKKSISKRSSLLCAVQQNSQPVAEFLITKGADVNTKDLFGQTPLHHAVINQNQSMIELLLSHQADINAKDKFGNTPLYFVFQQVNQDLRYSIEHFTGDNAIESQRQQLSRVEFLVNEGAIVNVTNIDGYSPLHFAAKERNKYLVKYLLKKGLEVDNESLLDGKTPLMLAVEESDNLPVIKLLIGNGADINAKDKKGRTVSKIALKNGNTQAWFMLKNQSTKKLFR